MVNGVAPGLCQSELLTREPGFPWVVTALQAVTGNSLPGGSGSAVDTIIGGRGAHAKYLNRLKFTRYVASLFIPSKGGIFQY